MKAIGSESRLARRSFLARLGVGAGVVGATVAGVPASAPAQAAEAGWKPARHAQDDWYDKIPGVHRFLLDTSSPDSIGWALQFANNYYTANQDVYGLKESDLAVIIVARHKSTSFAYTDAIWAKYGKGPFSGGGVSVDQARACMWALQQTHGNPDPKLMRAALEKTAAMGGLALTTPAVKYKFSPTNHGGFPVSQVTLATVILNANWPGYLPKSTS